MKIINTEELVKKQQLENQQKLQEEMMRGLAGLAARSSDALVMPQGYNTQILNAQHPEFEKEKASK